MSADRAYIQSPTVMVYATTRAVGVFLHPMHTVTNLGSQVLMSSKGINETGETSHGDLEAASLRVDYYYRALNIMPSISLAFGNDVQPKLTAKSFLICSILLVCHGL